MATKKMQEKKAQKKVVKAKDRLATEREVALKYEKTGDWSSAFDCWTRIARMTKSAAEKKEAAGRAAAAKVRAEAKTTQSPALDDQLAESKTADANARSWDSAMPEPGYVPPPDGGDDGEGAPDHAADEDVDRGAGTATGAPTGEHGAAGAAIPKRTRRSTEPASPRERDSRLPPVGTVLPKIDRNGHERVRCTIVEGGVEYAGTIYKSLSGAAMAAARDLGLTNKTQNGFVFWQITKPARPASDQLETLDRAWQRYRGNVEALVKQGITDDNRSQVVAAIGKHAQVIESLREKVA